MQHFSCLSACTAPASSSSSRRPRITQSTSGSRAHRPPRAQSRRAPGDSEARGLVGVRILELREPERVARGEFDDVLKLCADLGLVVTLSLRHPLDPRLVELFERNTGVFFLIDHLGTGFAPPILGYRPTKPFEHIDAVISLARYSNIGLKLTGAPSLSVDAYPFRDIWQPITRLVDAFGAERVYWGSDYSRTAALHSYHDGRYYLAEIPGWTRTTRPHLRRSARESTRLASVGPGE